MHGKTKHKKNPHPTKQHQGDPQHSFSSVKVKWTRYDKGHQVPEVVGCWCRALVHAPLLNPSLSADKVLEGKLLEPWKRPNGT